LQLKFAFKNKNEFNIPTFENGKNYSIRFEMQKHYSHVTRLL